MTRVANVSADSLPSQADVRPGCPVFSACGLKSGLLTSMGDLEYFRIPLSRTKKRCREYKHTNNVLVKEQEGQTLKTYHIVYIMDSIQKSSTIYSLIIICRPCVFSGVVILNMLTTGTGFHCYSSVLRKQLG